MKLDRAAFLAIVSTLSAVACAAPVDDVDQASGAQTAPAGACVAPQVDRGVYPTAEACFALGESWGQCGAWNRHFYAGVARDAVERAGRGASAYDAGFEALSATCAGSRAEEARLTRFCGEIADKQLASGDATIRDAGFRFRTTTNRAELVTACTQIARGIRLESRVLLRRCIERSPNYAVFSCVEGLGFDEAPARCEDPNAVPSGERFTRCNEAVATECQVMDSILKTKPALDTKSCIQEAESMLAENGAPAPTLGMQQAAVSCLLGTVAQTCQASDAQAACAGPLAELRIADPQLTARGHLNAGSVFSKRCLKTMSALSAEGQRRVAACVSEGARAVVAGTKEMATISLDACVVQAALRAQD